jgi:hypothetical protein
MNTYEWIISKLEVMPQVGNVDNYVVHCHWKYVATDGTITKEDYGLQAFEPDPAQQNYVPYESLTKEIVEGWLNSSINVEAMKASLDGKIQDELQPSIVSLPIPW